MFGTKTISFKYKLKIFVSNNNIKNTELTYIASIYSPNLMQPPVVFVKSCIGSPELVNRDDLKNKNIILLD